MHVGQNLRFEVGSVTYPGTVGSGTVDDMGSAIWSTVAGVVVVMIIVIIPIIIFIVVFCMRRVKATAKLYTNRLAQMELKEADDRIRGIYMT